MKTHRQAPIRSATTEPPPCRAALVIHGPGKVAHIAARELVGELESAGWSTQLERAARRDASRPRHIDVVVGIDADIAALRTAALTHAPVLIASRGDRPAVDRLLDLTPNLDIRTSPIGIARIDRDAPTPIVQRAVVTPADPDAELAWTSPITHQLPLDGITHIAVDIPEPISRGPGGFRTRSTAIGVVMTFRSVDDASSVLLHPDDRYTIGASSGGDIVVHIDQHIHHRARRVRIGAHPVGLRVVDHPPGTP